MSLFQSNACAAFTWDDHGHIRGLVIERHGSHTTIRKAWQAERVGSRSHAELLQQGRRELSIDQDTTVIIGGNGSKVCFVDLKMPKIAPPDLHNALQFELAKHTPLPLDEMQWGYRIVQRIAGTELYLIRVIYFPREEWDSWLSAASGIETGVDMIIPAMAVLDPLARGQDACLPINGHQGHFLFQATDTGERRVVYALETELPAPIFGMGEEPLAGGGLDASALQPYSGAEQTEFAAAALLAMYGVSPALVQDRKRWLNVPREIRPTRNMLQKVYVTVLGAYLLFLCGILFTTAVIAKNNEYRAADAETRRLQEAIDKIESTSGDDVLADELETEVNTALTTVFSMPEALIEITALTSNKLWSTNFNWDAGELRFELQSPGEESDLTLQFQQSPMFADLTMRKRQLPDESVNYTINCRVVPPAKRHAAATTEAAGAPPAAVPGANDDLLPDVPVQPPGADVELDDGTGADLEPERRPDE